MKTHWMAVLAAITVGLAGNPATAAATFSTPVYGAQTSTGSLAVVSGTVAENSCDTTCSHSFTVNLPTGLSASAAAIWLNKYYIRFVDPDGGNISRVKLMLSKTSYNPTTGDFIWEIEANLTANPAPKNVTFEFGAWFTIAVGDNIKAKASEKTAANFVGAGGQCDSSAPCVDSSTYASVGTATLPFRQMMLRGFDVGTSTGNGLAITQIGFNTTGLIASGNSASGNVYCSLTASTTEDLDCTLGLAGFAFDTSFLTDQYTHDTHIAVSGSGWGTVTETSSSSSTATSFMIGLQKTILTPASSMKFLSTGAGFGMFFLYTTPSPGYISGQVSWELERPGTPAISHDTEQHAFVGFFY